MGTSGFFYVGGRVSAKGAKVEDLSAFHARPSEGMFPDGVDEEAPCENGVR